MKINQAIPCVRSKGLKFIEAFERLKLSSKGFSTNLALHIDKMDEIWKEVQSLEIEENEATIITIYQLLNWFFFPYGEPIAFRPFVDDNAEEEYNQLLLNLLYDRSIGQYPSVERSGAFIFAKIRKTPSKPLQFRIKNSDGHNTLPEDVIHAVSDLGILFLRSFERCCDVALSESDPMKMEREITVMQGLWKTATTVEVSYDPLHQRQLSDSELADLFFASGKNIKGLMLNPTIDKENKYIRFSNALLRHRQEEHRLSIEISLNEIFACTEKRT